LAWAGPSHREAGHVLSSAIAEAACPHQMVCMVVPDPPCVCDGILRSRDFFGSVLTGSQITCIDWHNTLCAARSGEVSSAFAGGHQLQKTQSSGVSPSVECARQISVLHRLADIFSAVSCPTSDHGAAGRVLRRAIAQCDLPTSDGEPEPVGLALCVRRFAVPACFCSPAPRVLSSFVCLRVHNSQGLPLGMLVHCQYSCLFPLLCSLLRPLLLLHTIC